MPEPALARASPSGAIAGTYTPLDHVQKDVLMDDGTWAYCEALGWARDVTGRWRIKLLRYGTDSAGRRTQLEDWWVYDPARVRDAPGPPDQPHNDGHY